MSRFQPTGVPDPNNVPASADVSLTQTQFIAPAPNQNLSAIIQGLSQAVGLATEQKNKKIEANIRLNQEQKDQYNAKAREDLFRAEQRYNEADTKYQKAVASGDESLIAESKGYLLTAMDEVGLQTSRLADDRNIDLSIRKGAEDFSTAMFDTHSGIINATREAQEAQAKAEDQREIHMAIQGQMFALDQPHVMRTLIRSEQAQEGPPIGPSDRFESFAELSHNKFAEAISEATGLQGEELEEYMNSPGVQNSIIDQASHMMQTYNAELTRVVKEDAEAARKDHLSNTVNSAVFSGEQITIADRSMIMEAANASKSEVDYQIALKLSARYGRASEFLAVNNTKGWLDAIATADNLGISDLKGELSNQLVETASDTLFNNPEAYYEIRRQITNLYPDLEKMPSYLSEVKNAFRLNKTDILDFRAIKPAGTVGGFDASVIVDSGHRARLTRAQELETAWSNAVMTGAVYVNDGTQMAPLMIDGEYTDEAMELYQRYIGSQATLFLGGRHGLETTADTVGVLAQGLLQPDGPEEFLTTQEILERNNNMREALFLSLPSDRDRFMAQMLLSQEVRSDPNPAAFKEALLKAQRWTETEFSTPSLTKEDAAKVMKDIQPQLQGTQIGPEAIAKIRLDYSKMFAQDRTADPADIFKDAFEKFLTEHRFIDGQWRTFDIAVDIRDPEQAFNSIRQNMENNFFNERRLVELDSTVIGPHTQQYDTINPDTIGPMMKRWDAYAGSYEYQSAADVAKNYFTRLGGPIKAISAIRQPGHLLTGSKVINGQVYSEREITKAAIADRLMENSNITDQILSQTQDVEIPQIQWVIASVIMGDNIKLDSDGISVRTVQLTTQNGEEVLSFDIDRRGSLDPIMVTIPMDVYRSLASDNLATTGTVPVIKETKLDEPKTKRFDRFAP